MRTFVIGDIHGCYNQLKNLIDGLKRDKNLKLGKDRLIFLGDYIDRGPASREVVRYI